MSPRGAKSSSRSPHAAAAESSPPPRRTQRQRSSQAERALLDAATSLFALRGVDQTSLAQIGEHAGYSRGLVNHHFGTKDVLVDQLARRTQNDFVAALDDADGDAIDVLVKLADTYLSTIERGAATSRAFFVMWGAAIPAEATLRPVFATDDARFRLGVEAVLRAGQDSKTVIAELDPILGAVILVGMLRGVGAQYLIDPDAFDMSAARQACEQFVRRAFAAPRKRLRTKE